MPAKPILTPEERRARRAERREKQRLENIGRAKKCMWQGWNLKNLKRNKKLPGVNLHNIILAVRVGTTGIGRIYSIQKLWRVINGSLTMRIILKQSN